jgi:hypothetical protein
MENQLLPFELDLEDVETRAVEPPLCASAAVSSSDKTTIAQNNGLAI